MIDFIKEKFFSHSEVVANANVFSMNDVLIVLFFAILVVLLFKKIHISPVIGYIAAGAIIGPFGLKLTGYNDTTKSLAEFGVVFLLFSIGLELTYKRLLEMRKFIFGLGALQFFLTSIILSYLIYNLLTKNIITAIILGTSFAMSSTAIILKLLAEKHQSNTKSGKISISVLLFQDLAVVPIFILIPLLNNQDSNLAHIILSISLKTIFGLLLVFAIGFFVIKPLFRVIAKVQYNELFIATTLLIVLSSAAITHHLGLSLALGAFIAGIIIAETEFQPKVHSIIDPFKGLFLGFFFITEIGMHFDISLAIEKFIFILSLAISLIIVKALIFLAICIICKIRFNAALKSALLLSQAGEFAFVIFDIAKSNNFLNELQFQTFSIVVAISMTLTPVCVYLGDKFINRRKLFTKNEIENTPLEYNQTVIAGVGRTGVTIANIMEKSNIHYTAIDQNSKNVTRLFKKKYPVYIGDITDIQYLKLMHLENAALLIITVGNKDIIKIVKNIKIHFPNLKLIVKADDRRKYKQLQEIGVDNIILERQEVGIKISKEILHILGEEDANIHAIIDEYRAEELESIS